MACYTPYLLLESLVGYGREMRFSSTKYQFLIISVVILSCTQNAHKEMAEVSSNNKELTIAFGSCAHSYDTLSIFNAIESHKPAVWVWLGDIMYGDSHDMGVLEEKYHRQKMKPEYQRLLSTSKILGIWDDHDYGVNDGGKYY